MFWIFSVTNFPFDYTLNNPDTLTKYKTAAQISHKVLEAVSGRTLQPPKELAIGAYTIRRMVC